MVGLRTQINSVERLQGSQILLSTEGLRLIRILKIEEEKQFILDKRTAHPKSGILSLEEGVRQESASFQHRISGHVVIAIEIEGAAVIIVAARAGNDVDGSNTTEAVRYVVVQGCDLKLLHHFLGEVNHRSSPIVHIHNAQAIQGENSLSARCAAE